MAEVEKPLTAAGPASPSRKRSASPSPTREAIPTTTSNADSSALTTILNTDTTLAEQPPAKKTKLIRRKRRPARPQIDPSLLKNTDQPVQTGTVFNIWYNKWAGGDREDALLSKTKAINRCNVSLDSGWTTADKVTGSYFCLFFARGICPKGHECQYLHRLPTLFDQFNPNIDCFGRDKHSDYRDDMGGVGSFLRQNRTLYVGRIHVTDDIEEVVARHFQEWGEIERVRVLTGRGVAFVTYVNESNSSFAKEAMAHQSLDHEEILNVRWATVDPNPLSAKREAARIEEQAAEAVRRALPAAYVAQIEGRETADMRERRLKEGRFGLEGYDAPDAVWLERSRELEGIERRGLIEDGRGGAAPATEAVSTIGTQDDETQNGATANSTGLLSASTLAALQNRGTAAKSPLPKPQTNGTTKGSGNGSGGGLLVGYGSDDD